jgi:predicted nicotinamide N-methyase
VAKAIIALLMLRTIADNLRRTVKGGDMVVTTLPLVPEISLYLLSEDYPRGRLDYDEMMAIMDTPAYWAFCWASGQVLARYVLDHRGRFAGRTTLDLGTGSGVVAIAAALAGAQAIACDLDANALDAARANELDRTVDIVLAADVLYDRDNLPLLERLPRLANEVIVADSRVRQDTLHGYAIIDRMTATTVPDLDELREFSHVRIYRAVPVPPPFLE